MLTKPSKPSKNDGNDNEDYDYILYVNDILGSADGHRFVTYAKISGHVGEVVIINFFSLTKLPHFGCFGSWYFWSSCEMSKHKNKRNCCRQSC